MEQQSNFANFLQAVEKDPAMKDRFSKVSGSSQMVEFAQKLGYSVTEKEAQDHINALGLDLINDDDLNQISGGQSVVKPQSNYWYSGD
jgi:predicted ribosomally synthesized peptide with nif11-like leader